MKIKFNKIHDFKLSIIVLSLILIAANSSAQNPSGKSLLEDGIHSFELFGVIQPASVMSIVTVKGQPFSQAIKINTFNKTKGTGTFGLNANLSSSLHKGDVLWISFKMRSLESRRETGESFVELRVDQLVNGKYVWPPYLERGISFGTEWTETKIPFVIHNDVPTENIKLVLNFDSYPERFEIGPVTLINCGHSVSLDKLPRTVFHYQDDAADAPWRKAAADRIEKFRKGNLIVKVIDVKGKPVANAKVVVAMTRNAFNWGTATNSKLILDTINAESKIYRDTLLKYFNQVVFENEMKWQGWWKQDNKEKGAQTKKAVQWLKAHHIDSRGHVMVWPSWEHSPSFLTSFKNDTAAIRTAIFKNIEEQTTIMGGQFTQWDVVNEPYAHNDFLKMLGRGEMIKWFKAARVNTPGVKLFLNDYTMFIGEGANSPSEKFYDNIKFLIDNGAPIDAIGEQGHIGGTPPAITKVLARLDRFAQLGLPIQISEFDINSNDDELKAKYMGDFMTAIYSHPSTIGFVQWGFWEPQHWFPVAALWNKDWTLRKNGKVFTNLVSKTWWTNTKGQTKNDGTFTTRGFCGNYAITIKSGNTTMVQQVTLTNKGNAITIRFVK